MAFSKKIYGDAVKMLTDNMPMSSERVIARDLNDILETNVDDVYYMAQGYLDTLKRHKIREKARGHGFGYIVVNAEGIANPIANTILATGGSGKERNLIYQPKDGVAGKLLPTKQTGLNNEGIRVMTPTEWGRLQGFIGYAFVDDKGVDHFSFPEGTARAQQYKQFGNSVTIPVIEELAKFMLGCFEKMNSNQVNLIIQFAKGKESIIKRDVMELLDVSKNRAGYLLKKLVSENKLILVGAGTKSRYIINEQ